MTTHTHTRQRRPLVGLAALGLAVAGLALGFPHAATPSAASTASAADSSYGWPVKPFDRQHPVRGSFGDPRTLFKAPPTLNGALTSEGSFSFHQGVDISAPGGTGVYPVVSGLVTEVSREWVRVSSGGGRAFEYWHIIPTVRVGQQVAARQTVLGRVTKVAQHVHLTQLVEGRAVNPLAGGRLTPYSDSTTPTVRAITFRGTETGRDLLPHFLRGRVIVVVDAFDMPSMRVPGAWRDLPVSPALVSWRIQRWTGRTVVAERTARDVRESVPHNSSFWQTYVRGTYQNMAVFGPHYSFLQRGAYLFKLTPRPFDTRELPDGVYDLVVTAADIRGNRSTHTQRFLVHNRPGWVG